MLGGAASVTFYEKCVLCAYTAPTGRYPLLTLRFAYTARTGMSSEKAANVYRSPPSDVVDNLLHSVSYHEAIEIAIL
jgi:hypothetical protein